MYKIIGVASLLVLIWNFFLDPDPKLLKSRSRIRIKLMRIYTTAYNQDPGSFETLCFRPKRCANLVE